MAIVAIVAAVVILAAVPVVGQLRRAALMRTPSQLSEDATFPASGESSITAVATSSSVGATSTGSPSADTTEHSPLTEPAYREPVPVPSRHEFESAVAFAKKRQGIVSFAVIDSTGKMYGYHPDRQYVSASVVKAMLLVAYLRSHPTLSSTAKAELSSMIHVSDNNAAGWTQDAVGNRRLYEVAKRAGMKHFSVSGRWYRSQITPADQARFFLNMDSLIPKQHVAFARKLLSSIASYQSWGTAAAARANGWDVYFKGGWRGTNRGQLVHQSARLEKDGQIIAIVVMTDGDPSMGYGIATIRGIAERLIAPAP